MTFGMPMGLLALAVVPALLALHLLARRRPTRYAVAFTNVELLRSVMPPSSSWRRFTRLGMLLAAMAALAVGLAQPQVAVSVPKERATITLAMDVSGSMIADDVSPSRLAAATTAAQRFVNDLPEGFEVSLVPFSSTAGVAVAPTRSRAEVTTALAGLHAEGGTAIGEAIRRSLSVARPPGGVRPATPRAPGDDKARVILLLSDGQNSIGIEPRIAAEEAAAEGVRIYTIAFGTPEGTVDLGPGGSPIPVPPDPDALRAVAETTGGSFFEADDAGTLERVYDQIGSRVGSTTEKRDVAWAFGAAGAALLLGAGLLSTLWRGRLP